MSLLLLFLTFMSLCCNVLCLVTQLCPALCDSMDCSSPGSSVYGDSPGKNTGVGCHVLLQGIFLTQGLNPGLPYCRQILYQLSHQGSSLLISHNWIFFLTDLLSCGSYVCEVIFFFFKSVIQSKLFSASRYAVEFLSLQE